MNLKAGLNDWNHGFCCGNPRILAMRDLRTGIGPRRRMSLSTHQRKNLPCSTNKSLRAMGLILTSDTSAVSSTTILLISTHMNLLKSQKPLEIYSRGSLGRPLMTLQEISTLLA
ncbi:unnamed protein product [Arabidopsis halleri]